jgi:predicted nucleic acid-binding protein
MRVVLDCNVLISAGLNPGICRTVLHEVLESHQCILSAQILREYVTVARRKRFAGVQETLISLIQVVSRNAAFVAPEPSTLHLPDPKDRAYLERRLPPRRLSSSPGTKSISPIRGIRAYGSSRRGSFWR